MSTANSYSQNSEDLIVAKYFGDKIGTLLELGANDGITFSNSRYLIEKGWKAFLVEPSSACDKLVDLYNENLDVDFQPIAIGTENGNLTLFESGAHVPRGTDRALVSTMVKSEMRRWPNVEFNEEMVVCVTFGVYYAGIGKPKLDFISIDIEGMDWAVLQQINLHEVGCSCLCIEWNSKQELLTKFTEYTQQFGMRVLHINAENVIFCV